MLAIGYARVSTDKQADRGVSLDAQSEKIRAMATVQGAELLDVVVDGGESAGTLKRPGLQQILELVRSRRIQAVIVAKLDRLTRSVKDLCSLLELFEKRGVALVSVAESLDTSTAAGRLVITIMSAVSQWEANRTKPSLEYMPAIIRFLGYNPVPPGNGWAERLVLARTALGITQRESARRMGVDASTLARWERGERQPSGDFAKRAMSFLSTLGHQHLVQARTA